MHEQPASHHFSFPILFTGPVGTEIQLDQWEQLYVSNSTAIFDSGHFYSGSVRYPVHLNLYLVSCKGEAQSHKSQL